MLSIELNNLKAIEKAAKELISKFPQQRVFAFYGKMGAGKTTFIQAICRQLGTHDNITSPSFAIINEYKTPAGDSIFHFDFYRIKEMEEAYDLGYEDYFYSGNYCLIEWPEKIEPLLPEGFVSVNITVENNEARKITASL